MKLSAEHIADIGAQLPCGASREDATIAIVSHSRRRDVRFARSEVTTNADARGHEVSVIAFQSVSGGMATASVSDTCTSTREVEELVSRAHAAAAQLPAAADAAPLIPDNDESHPHDRDSSNSTDPAANDITDDQDRNLPIEQLRDMFAMARSEDVSLFGYGEVISERTWVASTTGLRRQGSQTHGRFEVTAKSDDGRRSSWWGYSAADLHGIPVHEGWDELRTGLQHQRKRSEIKPGRHTVILSPSAVGDLMVDLWWHAQAPDAFDGRSVFSSAEGRTLLNTQVSDTRVLLESDPHHPLVPASTLHAVASSSPYASVFDTGADLTRQRWIDSGTLTSLMCTRAFASEHDVSFSPSADTLALTIDSASGTLADLIARTDRGILITCLWYNRLVDPRTLLLTGLTRDGVYAIHDGAIVASVGNFRFNDSPVGILNRVSDAGDTIRTLPREMGDYAPRVAMPPLMIQDFNLSSVSDAI